MRYGRRAGSTLDDGSNDSLTLCLDAPALRKPRDALRLTLAIADHDPASLICLADTSASVSLLASGVAAQQQPAAAQLA
ncbi:hypothetical protein [Streptomyces sp. NPDC001657]|uniref:hypothetical protein n=1 Tax=Streptomyces sp. NPDC001657 TaxID=3154522 RepID=UPI0033187093